MKKNEEQQEECFLGENEKAFIKQILKQLNYFGWCAVYGVVCAVYYQVFCGAISEVRIDFGSIHISGMFLFVICTACCMIVTWCRFIWAEGEHRMISGNILGGSLVPILLTCSFRYRYWYLIAIFILIASVIIAFVSIRNVEEKSFAMYYHKTERIFTYLFLIYGAFAFIESTYSYQRLVSEYEKESSEYEETEFEDMNEKKWESLSKAERISYLDWIVGREVEYLQMPGVYTTMAHNAEINARYEPGELVLRWNSGIADASFEQGVKIALQTIYCAYEQYVVPMYDDSFELVKEAQVDKKIIELWRKEISFLIPDISWREKGYWMEKMAQEYAEERIKEYM